VHLGFCSAQTSEELVHAVAKAEELLKGEVNHLLKNENGVRLVWKVNLKDKNLLNKLFEKSAI